MRPARVRAAAALAVLAYVAAVAAWLLWRELGPHELRRTLDLRVYVDAGRWLLADHGTLYGRRFTSAHLDFTYTPFAALTFAALAVLPLWAAKWILVVGGGVVALAGCTWLAARRLGYRGAGLMCVGFGVAALALWTEPVQQDLYYGQVNVVLMLLVLGDALWLDRHAPRLHGVGIGLAAGIKLVPGVFILFLLVTGRVRAGIRAGLVFVLTVAVGWLLLPGPSETFWTGVFDNTHRIGKVGYVGNQSLLGVLFRGIRDKQHAHVLWMVAAVIVLAVGLWLARRCHQRGAEVLAVLVTGVTGLLCSPISWSHHWVWVAVALVLAAHQVIRSRGGWRWVGVLLATYAAFVCLPLRLHGYPALPLGLIWLAPFNPREHVPHLLEYHWTWSQSLVGDLYPEVGLVFLASALVLGAKNRHPQGEAVGAESGPADLDRHLSAEGAS